MVPLLRVGHHHLHREPTILHVQGQRLRQHPPRSARRTQPALTVPQDQPSLHTHNNVHHETGDISPGRLGPLLPVRPAVDPAGQAEPVEQLWNQHQATAVRDVLRAVPDAQRSSRALHMGPTARLPLRGLSFPGCRLLPRPPHERRSCDHTCTACAQRATDAAPCHRIRGRMAWQGARGWGNGEGWLAGRALFPCCRSTCTHRPGSVWAGSRRRPEHDRLAVQPVVA